MKQEELKAFILNWNIRFPIDKWWREKHKVAFLSKEHKESNFLYQVMEYEEDKLFNDLKEEKQEYIPNIGDFLKAQPIKTDTEEDFIKFAKGELDNIKDFKF